MPTPRLPKSVYEETARLFFEYGKNVTAAARASGVGYQTYASRLKKAREMGLADRNASSSAEEKERVVSAKVVLKPVYRIQQRRSKPDETKRVLAIGDCHDGPNLPDKTRFYAMGRYAKENQVGQIIQIGDFASVDSLNRFDGNETLKGKEKPSFGQDMKSFQEAIRAFHKGLDGYDVPKHVTLGNHEDRIWSYTNKNPEIVNMLDQILFATMDDYGWTYSPYGEFYFIGDVGFTHAPLNTMGKAYGGMQSENQIARDAMHDIVYGHTHKRLDKTFPKIGNQFVNIINLGTSLPEGHIEEYARHTLTGWSYGVYDIRIKDGKIYETNWLPMGKLMQEYGEGYAGDK